MNCVHDVLISTVTPHQHTTFVVEDDEKGKFGIAIKNVDEKQREGDR